jgi:hypothetical protein
MSCDALIDAIVAGVELSGGAAPAWVRGKFSGRALAPVRRLTRPASWSRAELAYLRSALGSLPVPVIAQKLGRSEDALHVIQVRKRIPAPSRQPGWLTGNQAARVLGVDIHAVAKLAARGVLPMERIPGLRGILRVRVLRLYAWAINPLHWMYFKPEKMGDRRLARLVVLAQSRWNDEWWTIGKAAAFHGVTVNGINQQIRRGKLPGAVDWGNWWIRRSDVEKMTIRPGKGSNRWPGGNFTPAADAFLRRAYEMGLTTPVIGRMMKRDPRAVNYRMRSIGLKRSPQWMHAKREATE